MGQRAAHHAVWVRLRSILHPKSAKDLVDLADFSRQPGRLSSPFVQDTQQGVEDVIPQPHRQDVGRGGHGRSLGAAGRTTVTLDPYCDRFSKATRQIQTKQK